MKIIYKTNPGMELNSRQILVRSFLNASYLIKRHKESILARYDITLQKFNILQILYNAYPVGLSQNQIREKLTDKTVDLPRIVKQLDTACLIHRIRNKSNKRISEITITPKGMEMLKEIDQCSVEMNLSTVHLSEEEVTQMTEMIQKMSNVLTESAAALPEFVENEEVVVIETDGTVA